MAGRCITVRDELVPSFFLEFESAREIDRALYSFEEVDQIDTAETVASQNLDDHWPTQI